MIGIEKSTFIYEIRTFKKVRELQTQGKKMITSSFEEESGFLAVACDSKKVFVFDKNSLVQGFERIETL